MILDREIYRQRWGDPSTWFSDCSARPGRYLRGQGSQEAVSCRLQARSGLLVGMAIRRVPATVIAACLGVSREAVVKRLRPLGLNAKPGRQPVNQRLDLFAEQATMTKCPAKISPRSASAMP